jgi:hypothetical protein
MFAELTEKHSGGPFLKIPKSSFRYWAQREEYNLSSQGDLDSDTVHCRD